MDEKLHYHSQDGVEVEYVRQRTFFRESGERLQWMGGGMSGVENYSGISPMQIPSLACCNFVRWSMYHEVMFSYNVCEKVAVLDLSLLTACSSEH